MKSRLLLATALSAFMTGDAAIAASMHTMVFTSSGTFTIPATAANSTEFEFTVIGGGGGGGGCSGHGYHASSGGSGGAGFASFSGFTASQTVTITIGAAGAAGGSGGGNGGTGGTSKATFSATAIITSTGGTGSIGESSGTMAAGAAGTFSAAVGGTGLTLASSLDYGAQDGMAATFDPTTTLDYYTIPGGSNPIGHAGTLAHHNGVLGGGGLGCQAVPGAGGTGGSGVVIVRWAL